MKAINLKQEIKDLKNLLQDIVNLQEKDEINDHRQHIITLKALNKAEILDINFQYPSAAAGDIVATDKVLAEDLHTYLGYHLQDKEVA
tara:strand:- start:511 stop:774 length:264 start_codon:yes stop_codon:yes gene_type:complete